MLLASLIPFVFGGYYQQSPCDCFSVELMSGYPKVTGREVCYRYSIRKTDYSCRMNLDYYILSTYVYKYHYNNTIQNMNQYIDYIVATWDMELATLDMETWKH